MRRGQPEHIQYFEHISAPTRTRTGPLAALPSRPAATLTGAADQLTARIRSARHL